MCVNLYVHLHVGSLLLRACESSLCLLLPLHTPAHRSPPGSGPAGGGWASRKGSGFRRTQDSLPLATFPCCDTSLVAHISQKRLGMQYASLNVRIYRYLELLTPATSSP